jgi:hypothetical protein
MDNNFLCNDCGEGFYLPNYIASYTQLGMVYKHKGGSVIQCDHCKGTNISSIKKKGKFSCTFGKFASMDDAGKKRVLKKRSQEHDRTKNKERREYLDRNFTGTTKGLTFKE